MKFKIIILLFISTLFIIMSCQNKGSDWMKFQVVDSCNNTSFIYEEFDINILPSNDLPYYTSSTWFSISKYYNSDSVPLFYKGYVKYYHPVILAQYSIHLLNKIFSQNDTSALNHSIIIVDKLIENSFITDSTIFTPYLFDFALHSIEEENIQAPWFSGMAQGLTLSVVCRLYELTGDDKYLALSHKYFNSFKVLKSKTTGAWVSCVDSNQNLWLEEYPRDIPCLTLNGMIFAIYGIYDYYRITKNEEAERYLKAAITTIKVNVHKYRVPNECSYYCLKHENQNESYHKVHIEQLNNLFRITGDEYFRIMSEELVSDDINQISGFSFRK